MNEHSLTKLFLVTNMHLYIDPKRGFVKKSNFEQVHHFCSKQAVQKQWSMTRLRGVHDIPSLNNISGQKSIKNFWWYFGK